MTYRLVLHRRRGLTLGAQDYSNRDQARRAARRLNDRMRRNKTATAHIYWDYMEVRHAH